MITAHNFVFALVGGVMDNRHKPATVVHHVFRRRELRALIIAEGSFRRRGCKRTAFSADANSSIPLETPMIRTPTRHSTKTSATSGANTAHRSKSDPKPTAASKDGVQGEGNYEAAREFNAAERKFVASGKVAAAARAAAPKSEAERQAMFAAEEEGKRRAKE